MTCLSRASRRAPLTRCRAIAAILLSIASLTAPLHAQPAGQVDLPFGEGQAGTNGNVLAVAQQPDGRIVIGGTFTTVNGATRRSIARLNANGTLDTDFAAGLAGPNHSIEDLILLPDGRIVIAGRFTSVHGVMRYHIARLNSDGSLDESFGPGPSGVTPAPIFAIARQADGRLLIGGAFRFANAIPRRHIARLNENGTIDATFGTTDSGASSTVWAIAVQPNGRIVIAGQFLQVNGVTRQGIARLNADGSLDRTFGEGLTGVGGVDTITVQSDGRVLVGGAFTGANDVPQSYITRFDASGALDPSFIGGTAGVSGAVYCLRVQPDGRIVIGGTFTSVSGQPRSAVARLHADGSLDTDFGNGLTGINGMVFSCALQNNGKILVVGSFSSVHGVTRRGIARLLPTGDVVFRGSFE